MSRPDQPSPAYDFIVKDPPQLPTLFRDNTGSLRPTSKQDAQYHVARYNQNGTGFDVAADSNNTAHWPYHMGAPSEDPGNNPLIAKWGLQILEAAGFINHESEPGDTFPDAIGRRARIRNPQDLEEEQIHPVLRKDMFDQISEDDYELMKPAIILASAILDDPITLHFFCAVSLRAQYTEIDNPNLGKCNIVTIPPTLTQARLTAANKKVMDMRTRTSWEVRDHQYFDQNIGLALTETVMYPNASQE